MDEASVQSKARQFVAKVDTSNIQNDLTPYLNQINAKVVYEELEEGESGYTIEVKGRPRITINSLESNQRQRFTICHEIAHIVLGLPSNHEELPSWTYAKKDINETFCDMFAAELLMPYKDFMAKIPDEELSADLIEHLALEFNTSFPATGSRLATLIDKPCAFVTIDHGIIRHASRSMSLRNAGAWIPPRTAVPVGSVAHRLRSEGVRETATEEVSQDIWFTDWPQGSDLWEISRHYPRYDQTITLLWFEEEDLLDIERPKIRKDTFEHAGLKELTGEMTWPGKRRRR